MQEPTLHQLLLLEDTTSQIQRWRLLVYRQHIRAVERLRGVLNLLDYDLQVPESWGMAKQEEESGRLKKRLEIANLKSVKRGFSA